MEEQEHGFPALLSFFLPGLGQIVKGEVGKCRYCGQGLGPLGEADSKEWNLR